MQTPGSPIRHASCIGNFFANRLGHVRRPYVIVPRKSVNGPAATASRCAAFEVLNRRAAISLESCQTLCHVLEGFARQPACRHGSMRPMLRRSMPVALALVVAWYSCAARAVAAEPNQLAEARELANGAADDLEAQRYDAALEKAERAEQLYHAPPHILMIAEALEGLGQLVKALDMYERLAAEPLSPSAPAAFRKARELGAKKERSLLSRVPSILIDVTGASIEDAKASVDGHPIALRSGVATRLDPGKHTVRVESDGFKPVEVTVDLANRGGVTKVPVQLEVGNARRTPDSEIEPSSQSSTSRRFLAPALVTLGVGVAASTAGTVMGLLSMSRVDELEGKCIVGTNNQYRCPTKYEGLIAETRRFSDISTSMFIVGGVALVTGIVLLIPSKPSAQNAAFQMEPFVGLGGAGVRGQF